MEENKIKPTMPIPTDARLVFSKLKSTEFSSEIIAANLNGYEILVIQLVHIQDLCGNSSHFCHFLRNESLVPLPRFFPYSFRKIGVASGYGEGCLKQTVPYLAAILISLVASASRSG